MDKIRTFRDGQNRPINLMSTNCGTMLYEGRVYEAYRTTGLSMGVWIRLEPYFSDEERHVKHVYAPSGIDAWLTKHAHK